MSNNFWSKEDEFRDSPVEMENGQWKDVETAEPPQQARPAKVEKESEPELSLEELDLFPDGDSDEEDDFSVVLSDARLRLEQGRLYEMILNHSLFQDLDADPRAVKNVQKEIKRFARERMEIMLGMRRETSKVEHLEIDFPFNKVEVEVLKKLAYAATKGHSENSDKFVTEVKRTTSEVPTVGTEKKRSITPISKGSNSTKPVTKLAASPQKPMERAKAKANTPVSEEDYKPLEKHPSEMTPDELKARNAEASARIGKQAKSTTALPQPSYAEQEMMYAQGAMNAAPAVSTILAAINMSQKK
jgi:hypothetical protein